MTAELVHTLIATTIAAHGGKPPTPMRIPRPYVVTAPAESNRWVLKPGDADRLIADLTGGGADS